ncbi:hypothetical protein SABR111722_04535 [Saccharibacillus brassicae]
MSKFSKFSLVAALLVVAAAKLPGFFTTLTNGTGIF